MDFLLPRSAHTDMWRTAVPEDRVMRRALMAVVFLAVAGASGCITPDDKRQWQEALKDLRGENMSVAYRSALDLSFAVRSGLFVRQVHHWAALLFLAAMFAHMFRTFFTGAFRKPSEANWIIGLVLVFIGTFEGFSGYSLPDDLLSGTGLRIASGITLSVPVIGTWTQWALFGGE
ncbi:MAG: cytochrome b N-terminal domain-containing protein, partial [Planctomycetes bacterium]|nr:cytochrome b N-terminal domain-containing protein [Planctomycetota bacterium]